MKITKRMIARDVLKMLETKRIVAESMIYCQVPLAYEERGKSLQQLLQQPGRKPCKVCALGAVFVAHVDRTNKVDAKNYFGEFEMRAHLSKVFTEDELLRIEDAFEGFKQSMLEHTSTTLFNKLISDDHDRLVAIMKNIVRYGEFKPELEAWTAEQLINHHLLTC